MPVAFKATIGPVNATGSAEKGGAISSVSRRLNDLRHDALAPDLRLFEFGGDNRAVQGGAQLLRGLKRQLDPGARAGLESGVDEIERDHVTQRGMARVV